LATLFGADAASVARTVEFCGTFNLGISLFDWLCDEKCEVEALLTAPPFHEFAPSVKPMQQPPDGPVHKLLRSLAEEVLTRIGQSPGPTADALRHQLSTMMLAQAALSRAVLAPGSDLSQLASDARLKSSGPFRFMAEWAALGTTVDRARAAVLGLALGDVFWLVDDATDVWQDIDAGRWNLVIAAAARTDAGLMALWNSPEFEFRLSAILLRPGWAETLIAPILDAAAPVLRDDPGTALAASVELWLT
jgi:hypothetical protein